MLHTSGEGEREGAGMRTVNECDEPIGEWRPGLWSMQRR